MAWTKAQAKAMRRKYRLGEFRPKSGRSRAKSASSRAKGGKKYKTHSTRVHIPHSFFSRPVPNDPGLRSGRKTLTTGWRIL